LVVDKRAYWLAVLDPLPIEANVIVGLTLPYSEAQRTQTMIRRKFQRGRLSACHPHRRMGLLHRLRYDLALGDAQGRTFIFEIFLRPHLGEDRQGFLPLGPSVIGIYFETGKFRFRNSAPAAEFNPSIGQ